MKLTPESTRVLYANSDGGTVVLIINHVTGARRWEVYERGKTSSRAAGLKERQEFESAIASAAIPAVAVEKLACGILQLLEEEDEPITDIGVIEGFRDRGLSFSAEELRAATLHALRNDWIAVDNAGVISMKPAGEKILKESRK